MNLWRKKLSKSRSLSKKQLLQILFFWLRFESMHFFYTHHIFVAMIVYVPKFHNNVNCPNMYVFQTWMFIKKVLFLLFQVLELEQEKGEWGFKALKQMVKTNYKMVCIVLNNFMTSLPKTFLLLLLFYFFYISLCLIL